MISLCATLDEETMFGCHRTQSIIQLLLSNPSFLTPGATWKGENNEHQSLLTDSVHIIRAASESFILSWLLPNLGQVYPMGSLVWGWGSHAIYLHCVTLCPVAAEHALEA